MGYKNREAKSIGSILSKIVNEHGWGSRLDEQMLISKWETIAGRMIARNTINLKLYNKKLYLKFESAALKHEISYAKSTLIENINNVMDKEVVREIVLE